MFSPHRHPLKTFWLQWLTFFHFFLLPWKHNQRCMVLLYCWQRCCMALCCYHLLFHCHLLCCTATSPCIQCMVLSTVALCCDLLCCATTSPCIWKVCIALLTLLLLTWCGITSATFFLVTASHCIQKVYMHDVHFVSTYTCIHKVWHFDNQPGRTKKLIWCKETSSGIVCHNCLHAKKYQCEKGCTSITSYGVLHHYPSCISNQPVGKNHHDVRMPVSGTFLHAKNKK